MIQLQGDQRKDVQEFLTDKKEGLELDAKTIKVCSSHTTPHSCPILTYLPPAPWFLNLSPCLVPVPSSQSMLPRERWDRKHAMYPLTAGRAHSQPSQSVKCLAFYLPLCARIVRLGPLSI